MDKPYKEQIFSPSSYQKHKGSFLQYVLLDRGWACGINRIVEAFLWLSPSEVFPQSCPRWVCNGSSSTVWVFLRWLWSLWRFPRCLCSSKVSHDLHWRQQFFFPVSLPLLWILKELMTFQSIQLFPCFDGAVTKLVPSFLHVDWKLEVPWRALFTSVCTTFC